MSRQLLREFIQGVLQERKSFSFDEFKNVKGTRSLKDYEAMIDYADARLPNLGRSTRSVYELGDGQVLKIARSPSGLRQNNVEINVATDSAVKPIITQMIDSDESGRWIVTQQVVPFNSPEDFESATGRKLDDIMRAAQSGEKNDSFTAAIGRLLHAHHLDAGDVGHFSHWGKNGAGDVLLYDYGYVS